MAKMNKTWDEEDVIDFMVKVISRAKLEGAKEFAEKQKSYSETKEKLITAGTSKIGRESFSFALDNFINEMLEKMKG